MIRTEGQITAHLPTLFRYGEGSRRCRDTHQVHLIFYSRPLWRWADEEDAWKCGEDTEGWKYDEIRWEARWPRWNTYPSIIPSIRTNRGTDDWEGPYAIKEVQVDWLWFHWRLEIFPSQKGLPAR